MVGGSTDALYTLNTMTGVATRVGSARRFGVNERSPRGLAYDTANSVLYMSGPTATALYTLNTTTGVATRVGMATRFGVNEGGPQGLAYDPTNRVLYMVGGSTDALYTLNTTTGVATRVGSAKQFGVNERSPRGLAYDPTDGVLYMVGETNDVLYTLNTTTGVAMRVGTATQFGLSENSPQGLAFGPASMATALPVSLNGGIADSAGTWSASQTIDLGDAHPKRHILIALYRNTFESSSGAGDAQFTINSATLTVGGTSYTLSRVVTSSFVDFADEQETLELWVTAAPVPTGTSGTLAVGVTQDAAASATSILLVHRLIDVNPSSTATVTQSGSGSRALTVPAGGLAVLYSSSFPDDADDLDFVWTGATELLPGYTDSGDNNAVSAAIVDNFGGDAALMRTVSVQSDGGSPNGFVGAVFSRAEPDS